jgi:hypothetical protein
MSTHIVARLLYNEIREQNPDGGLYVWADPDEPSVLKIQKLMSGAPFKTTQSTGYHVTILYHKHALPHVVKVPIDRPLVATVRELIVWDEPDGEKILVAALDSRDLQDLHAELESQYLEHSFPDYNAHLTVGKKLELNAQTRLFIDEANRNLEQTPLELVFGPEIKGSSIG